MAEHPNIARLRRGYEAFAVGNFAALDELCAEDVIFHVGNRNVVTEFWDASTDQYASDELLGGH